MSGILQFALYLSNISDFSTSPRPAAQKTQVLPLESTAISDLMAFYVFGAVEDSNYNVLVFFRQLIR